MQRSHKSSSSQGKSTQEIQRVAERDLKKFKRTLKEAKGAYERAKSDTNAVKEFEKKHLEEWNITPAKRIEKMEQVISLQENLTVAQPKDRKLYLRLFQIADVLRTYKLTDTSQLENFYLDKIKGTEYEDEFQGFALTQDLLRLKVPHKAECTLTERIEVYPSLLSMYERFLDVLERIVSEKVTYEMLTETDKRLLGKNELIKEASYYANNGYAVPAIDYYYNALLCTKAEPRLYNYIGGHLKQSIQNQIRYRLSDLREAEEVEQDLQFANGFLDAYYKRTREVEDISAFLKETEEKVQAMRSFIQALKGVRSSKFQDKHFLESCREAFVLCQQIPELAERRDLYLNLLPEQGPERVEAKFLNYFILSTQTDTNLEQLSETVDSKKILKLLKRYKQDAQELLAEVEKTINSKPKTIQRLSSKEKKDIDNSVYKEALDMEENSVAIRSLYKAIVMQEEYKTPIYYRGLKHLKRLIESHTNELDERIKKLKKSKA